MKRSVTPLLACPGPADGGPCGGMLSTAPLPGLPVRTSPSDPDEVVEGALRCGRCGAEYPVLSGVALLVPDPAGYLRRYHDAVARDLGRHGSLSPPARDWLRGHRARGAGTEDYGADFRFSQQFEDPWAIARAMAPDPGDRFGPFAAWLEQISGQGPYDLLAEWARERVSRHRLLLDAGCGGGGLVARAGAPFRTAFGVDLSFLAILLARRAVLHRPEPERTYLLPVRRGYEVERPLPVQPLGQAEFVVADCTALPFPPALFDAVCSSNVIDIAGIDRPLDEAARVLGPDGMLLLSDPFYFRDGEAPAGEPRAAVRTAIERRGLRVEAERDGVPWAWATYDRHWRVYFSYCLAARRHPA